jgi:REP element-mobilizing transposase RayT
MRSLSERCDRSLLHEFYMLKNYPSRKSQRWKSFDYSSTGWYFLTFCVQDRRCCLGHVENGEMILNAYGKIVYDEIICTTKMRPNITIEHFVIMPNHVHMIVGNDCVVPLCGSTERMCGSTERMCGSTRSGNRSTKPIYSPYDERSKIIHYLKNQCNTNRFPFLLAKIIS